MKNYSAHVYRRINPRVLMDSIKNDSALFCRLLEIYLRIAPPMLEQLQSAIAVNDFQAMIHHSHALKGSCCLIGAVALADMLEEIELQAKRAQPDHTEFRPAQLLEEFNEVLEEVQQCLRQCSNLD